MYRIYFAFVLTVLQWKAVYSLDCLSCQQIDDPHSCNTTITCPEKQVCSLNAQGGVYTLGCADIQHCGGAGGPGIVGRSLYAHNYIGHDVLTRQSSNCSECCSTDGCNSDLCKHSMLNGDWTLWAAWSNCDVTCGKGVQTRSRSCTNPAPANGGRGCAGNASETRLCQTNPCPVHGGWSTWSQWGSCSASCDVGLQRRDRSCSNPYPDTGGDHCFGESRDDRICLPGSCSDGGWSSWSSWDTCSESCGGGIRSQTRTCTNPNPSLLGKSCDGTPIKVSVCNRQACSENKVAFTAYGISNSSSHLVAFPYVLENYGNQYDNSTGRFTCKIPGIYIFSFQISKPFGPVIASLHCSLNKNYSGLLSADEDPYAFSPLIGNDKSGYSLSLSGTIHLSTNDFVYVTCNGIGTLYADEKSSFTGVLVIPDD